MGRLHLFVLIVAGAALAFPACRKAEVADETVTGPMAVDAPPVRLETLRVTVSGPGLVVPSAIADWTIYAPESGRIAELPKAEGDVVMPGDLLVRFEFGNLSTEISAREADIATVTSRIASAKTQLAKVQAMFDKGYTSRNELDTAKNALASAELDFSRAKAQLTAANASNERGMIKARFAGVVAKRYHLEGDLVNAATTDPVLRVVDPTKIQIAMKVSIQDLVKIQPGQQATVVTTNGPEPATVVVRPAPDDPQATMVEIRLAFTNPSTAPIDSPVQADILLVERPNVVAVPSPAILKTEDGATYVMIAGVDGRAHRRDVRLGLATRDRTEIAVGLTPGDRLIVKNPGQVPEGTVLAIER